MNKLYFNDSIIAEWADGEGWKLVVKYALNLLLSASAIYYIMVSYLLM